MRIVFMGTPEFAVPSLERLAASAHELAGVVTAPDRPKGRGLKMMGSPVKVRALEFGLPVLQPEDLKNQIFLKQLKDWQADCFVIVGFKILPPEVYEIPSTGAFNLHASLLPKYRGAAPIQWAIINGETETGVTTFLLRKQVDAGDVICQARCDIGPHENSGDLHDRLALLGAGIVVKTVDLMASGNVSAVPQSGEPTAAPKLTPELGVIDWSQPASQIHNLIRGLAPAPGAYSFLNGKRLKIFDSDIILNGESDPGRIVEAGHGRFYIDTGNHAIAVKLCQLEGKSKMSADAFLRGYSVSPGEHLTQESTG